MGWVFFNWKTKFCKIRYDEEFNPIRRCKFSSEGLLFLIPLPSNIKSLMSKESVWHRHRLYKVSYSEVASPYSVAFIIFLIFWQKPFSVCGKFVNYITIYMILWWKTLHLLLFKTNTEATLSSILNRDADFLRKEVIIDHLVFLQECRIWKWDIIRPCLTKQFLFICRVPQ